MTSPKKTGVLFVCLGMLLEEAIADQRVMLAKASQEIPRVFLVEGEYDLALREAEAAWVRSLLEELTTGSLSGIQLWRAWHETGQMPAELVDLAERGSTTD